MNSSSSMIYDYQLREFPTKEALADPRKLISISSTKYFWIPLFQLIASHPIIQMHLPLELLVLALAHSTIIQFSTGLVGLAQLVNTQLILVGTHIVQRRTPSLQVQWIARVSTSSGLYTWCDSSHRLCSLTFPCVLNFWCSLVLVESWYLCLYLHSLHVTNSHLRSRLPTVASYRHFIVYPIHLLYSKCCFFPVYGTVTLVAEAKKWSFSAS